MLPSDGVICQSDCGVSRENLSSSPEFLNLTDFPKFPIPGDFSYLILYPESACHSSNPAIPNNILPKLLPREKESNIRYLETDPSTKQHRRVSLAYTECQKRKSKCSGTNLCTKCTAEARQYFYNPAGDRRRKAHTAELLNFRVALY
ncbi:hypothetical protein ACN42_g11468 [Penicillium freii]|uniref:Zn(2)-C6 fungal-type domain-containing protein n=1 Tax=Penicillium freii TaxID=48697 RepID=A0A101M869_PENFR|nr:hypothetical protein ACN42_g11468 [Penicillium freii]